MIMITQNDTMNKSDRLSSPVTSRARAPVFNRIVACKEGYLARSS